MFKKEFFIPIIILIAIVIVIIFLSSSTSSQINLNLAHTNSQVFAAVVPHHNIVENQRKQFFTDLASKIGQNNFPNTIILISPNHYYAGSGKIQTTNQNWNLNEGTVNPNNEVISDLTYNRLAQNEPSSFINEHGIYNILADIHNTFPQAKLVPIILEDPNLQQLQKLEFNLKNSCDNCLMISSVDFSHYQTAALAELHDEKSIRDLQTLNTSDVLQNAEVDSGSALALLTMWANDHQTLHFNLKNHTNSDLLLHMPYIGGTSHVFGWYEAGQKIEPEMFISFVTTSAPNTGIKDRSIWGTDLIITEPLLSSLDQSKILIAGKLTPSGLEFFGLPLEEKGTSQLNSLFSYFNKYLFTNEAGQYIKIPNTENNSLTSLSLDQIKSKIKVLINLQK